MNDECGGCRNEGAHKRWCPNSVGWRASRWGKLSERADYIADSIGGNDPGLANLAYELAAGLRKIAEESKCAPTAATGATPNCPTNRTTSPAG